MTADREAAIRKREPSRCEKCAAPWDRDCDGRKLCAQDAVDYYLAELAAARSFSIAQQEVIVAQKERERLLREALRERFVTERGGCRLCDDYWENPDTPSGLECACGMLALVAFDVAGEQPCATCTTHVSCQEDGRACER